jgi:hypothetical protein
MKMSILSSLSLSPISKISIMILQLRARKSQKELLRLFFKRYFNILANFLQYAGLPGILNERFFIILDENGDGIIDQKEFIHAMFKVYYSKLESKIKLVFDM